MQQYMILKAYPSALQGWLTQVAEPDYQECYTSYDSHNPRRQLSYSPLAIWIARMLGFEDHHFGSMEVYRLSYREARITF